MQGSHVSCLRLRILFSADDLLRSGALRFMCALLILAACLDKVTASDVGQSLGRRILSSDHTEQATVIAVASTHQNVDTVSLLGSRLKVYQLVLLVIASGMLAFSLLAALVCIIWIVAPLSEETRDRWDKRLPRARCRRRGSEVSARSMFTTGSTPRATIVPEPPAVSTRLDSEDVVVFKTNELATYACRGTHAFTAKGTTSLQCIPESSYGEDSVRLCESRNSPPVSPVVEHSLDALVEAQSPLPRKHRTRRPTFQMTPAQRRMLEGTNEFLNEQLSSCDASEVDEDNKKTSSEHATLPCDRECMHYSEFSTFRAWQVFATAKKPESAQKTQNKQGSEGSVSVFKEDHETVDNVDPYATKCSMGSTLAAQLQACDSSEASRESPASTSFLSTVRDSESGGANQRFRRFYNLACDRVPAASVALSPSMTTCSVNAILAAVPDGDLCFDLSDCAAILGENAVTHGWRPQDRIEVSPEEANLRILECMHMHGSIADTEVETQTEGTIERHLVHFDTYSQKDSSNGSVITQSITFTVSEKVNGLSRSRDSFFPALSSTATSPSATSASSWARTKESSSGAQHVLSRALQMKLPSATQHSMKAASPKPRGLPKGPVRGPKSAPSIVSTGTKGAAEGDMNAESVVTNSTSALGGLQDVVEVSTDVATSDTTIRKAPNVYVPSDDLYDTFSYFPRIPRRFTSAATSTAKGPQPLKPAVPTANSHSDKLAVLKTVHEVSSDDEEAAHVHSSYTVLKRPLREPQSVRRSVTPPVAITPAFLLQARDTTAEADCPDDTVAVPQSCTRNVGLNPVGSSQNECDVADACAPCIDIADKPVSEMPHNTSTSGSSSYAPAIMSAPDSYNVSSTHMQQAGDEGDLTIGVSGQTPFPTRAPTSSENLPNDTSSSMRDLDMLYGELPGSFMSSMHSSHALIDNSFGTNTLVLGVAAATVADALTTGQGASKGKAGRDASSSCIEK